MSTERGDFITALKARIGFKETVIVACCESCMYSRIPMRKMIAPNIMDSVSDITNPKFICTIASDIGVEFETNRRSRCDKFKER